MGQVCTLYACCLCVKVLRVNESTKVPNPQCIGFEHGIWKFTYLILCGILVTDLRSVFCGIIGSCLLLILV